MLTATVRSMVAHKLRLLLTTASIALGVALLAGTLILTNTVGTAFDLLFGKIGSGTDAVVRAEAPYTQTEGVGTNRGPIPEDVLTAVRHGCTVAELGLRLFANAERHLKSPDEMRALFAECPDAVARTVEVAEQCTFSLDELRYGMAILRGGGRQLHPVGFGDVEVGGQLASAIERQAGMILNLLQRLQVGLGEGDALLGDTDDTRACCPIVLRAEHDHARDGIDAAGKAPDDRLAARKRDVVRPLGGLDLDIHYLGDNRVAAQRC